MAVASDHHEGSLQEEVELLEAIYIHELTIEGLKDRPSSISLLLHPSTGDEGEKQYVCLTLQIFLPNEYPNALPGIHISNPRGLSDAHVESIISNLRELAESRLGSPMLYELIDYAKDSLTDNNIPSCACAICLSHFQDSHCFTKTECYHYFHCSCLARYIEYILRKIDESDQEDKQIVCPMCRLPITYDLEALKMAPEDLFSDNEASYSPDKKMKRLQKEMAELFDKQLKKGGIINVEEEKNRFLIEIKTAPVQQDTEDTTVDDDRALDNDTDTGKPSSADVVVDQNKSTNYLDKGSEERRRERPSSSRKNRGRGRQHRHYRTDGRWDERNDGPRNERPSNERPRNERPSNERPRNERPRNERPRNERARNERPPNERPSNEGQRNEQPSNERPRNERPSNERPRNDRPQNERPSNDPPQNERPRCNNERGFQKGQRDREVNQKTQGTEKYKGSQGNETKTKNDRSDENKAVPGEINGLKSSNVQQDQNVQHVIDKSDVKSVKSGDTTEATISLESKNDDKSSLKITVAQKDNYQGTKRTESGYGEKHSDKTTGRKEDIPSHKKDFSHRRDEPVDQKVGSRSKGARNVRHSSPSRETSSRTTDREKIYDDDKSRRRQKRPKRPEQKDKDVKISPSNDGQYSPSRNDIENAKPLKLHSQSELTCENTNLSQSNVKTDDKSAAGVARPPPGFDRIEIKSRGPTGPPPGFESNDSLVGKQPPPGF
uniref:E3 ubiquitin-protein ligase RNF25-like isoform X2 n=1 Tax=Actinia tenebrosa TaxID=6105 RepID=A0A6P8J5T6_ACTTE